MNCKTLCCTMIAMIWTVAGCSSNDHAVPSGPGPEAAGWIVVGSLKVSQDSGRDALPAAQIGHPVRELRFDADGPAVLDKIVVTGADGTVEQPASGVTLDAGRWAEVPLSTGKRIDRIAFVHSGAGAFRKTAVTVWAR